MIRKLLFILALFIPTLASAAGGTCPSDAQVRNVVTGNLQALSTIGVTSCYFIAASGSDSNAGTTEGSPWAHAPGMPNCSSTCATVASGSLAGLGFIFKIGDTWHFGNSSATPYTGGVWSFTKGGTSATNQTFYGDSPSWTSTTSTGRPIMSADNPVNASTTLGSCSHSIGGNNLNNNFTSESSGINTTIRDFEWTGMCQSDVANNSGPGGACASPAAGTNNHVFTYGTTLTVEDNYFHGYSHVAFGNPNAPEDCIIGTVVFNSHVFRNGGGDENILYNVMDNSDSDPLAQGWGFYSGHNVAWNYIGSESFGGEMSFSGMCTNHDNTMIIMNDNGHGDWLEQLSASCSPVTIYNDLFIHMGAAKTQGGMWPFSGSPNYIFNTIFVDWASVGGEMVALGGTPTFPGNAQMNYFNDTFQQDDSAGTSVVQCASTLTVASFIQNVHIIYPGTGAAYGGNAPCNSNSHITITSPLTQSNATAKTFYPYGSQAYPTQQYPFSPVNGSSPTVGAGTNEMGNCNTLASNSNALIAAAGTACKSDTTYGVGYNSTTHRITGPGRVSVARPTSGAWDIGAYQFNGTVAAPIISWSPTSNAFGNVTTGATPTTTFTLSNIGSAPLNISLAMAGSSVFTIASTTCSGALSPLPAGSKCTVTVQFAPTAATSYSATLTETDSVNGVSGNVTVTGTGVSAAAPAVNWTPSAYNFGNVTDGTTVTNVFTLKNTGSATLNVSLSTTGSATFAVQSTTCGATLTAGSSCTVTEQFSPVAVTSYTGNLVETDTPNSVSGSASLSGTGIPTPIAAICWSPVVGSFPGTNVGTASILSFQLTNCGAATLNVSLSTSGVAFTQQSNNCPATLAPSANCVVNVQFFPTKAATFSGILTETDSLNSISGMVNLSGNGIVIPPNLPQMIL